MAWSILLLDPPNGALTALGEALAEVLGRRGILHFVHSGAALLETLRAGYHYDLIAVHSLRGDGERGGLELLRELRAQDPAQTLLAVADAGSVRSTAEAVAAGANDFLVLGPDLLARVRTLVGKLEHLVRLHAQQRRLHAELAEQHRILGDSPATRALVTRIQRLGPLPRPLLILGERGTGKELVAWNLHAAAGPPGRPMVCVNCAAFSHALLESELFGHERGAYTGADRQVPGRFEQADGGTLFLDEIGSTDLAFQQKILRAVEYGVFRRVGGDRELRSSARVVAATNADLPARMAQGSFLPDLYDRLSFEVIEVPPLRERPEDVPALARHFLERFALEFPALRGRELSEEALEALLRYPFPGNVRELKHIVERAAYRPGGPWISAADLGLPAAPLPTAGGGFEAQVEAFRARLLAEALERAGGNQAEAARDLGLTYDQLRYQLRRQRR
ncbi:MAG: sigma-54-dependent Fis family transcriptional regulator [Alphaproteobacteria bacterium]|nr:sigma-54-dependent Fis family transcriptional regulator [Alphaproteobacteria bacterium]